MPILRYQTSEGEISRVEFDKKRPVTVGRGKAADLQVGDLEMSRVHCAFRFWQGDYVVRDAGSSNGTFVNGTQVKVGKLKHGDKVLVGKTTFEFFLEEPQSATQIFRNVAKEIEGGKSYSSVLNDIIKKSESKPSASKSGSKPQTP